MAKEGNPMKSLFFTSLLVCVLVAGCASQAGTATTAPTSTQGSSTNPANCTDSAAFVADVTVPDGTNFNHGDAIHKVWRVKNTGTCTWSTAYNLVFASGDRMSAPASTALSETKPGDTVDIAVDLTAPYQDAAYRADFELHNAAGVAMPVDQAKTLWVAVTVGTPATSTAGGGSGGGTSTAGTLLAPTCAFTTDDARVSDVVAAINAYRSQNGLPAYTSNDDLARAAQSHSADMACNNLFVHTGSDGSTPSSRVSAAGFAATAVTENVYGSYPPLSGHDVVSWWATDQSDPNHNLNLISTTYKEIGVGYAFFGNYGYFTVVFAAP
jgi:uncharacterized protein YkwD